MNTTATEFLLKANREFLEEYQENNNSVEKASEKLIDILEGIKAELPMPASGKKTKELFQGQNLKGFIKTLRENKYLISPFSFWGILFTYKAKNIQEQRKTFLKKLISKWESSNEEIVITLGEHSDGKVLENLVLHIPELSQYAEQSWKLFEELMQDNPDQAKLENYIKKNNNGIMNCRDFSIKSIRAFLPFIRPDLQFYFDTDGTVTNIIRSKEMEIQDTIKLLKGSKQIILTGAPGTGKTYHATKVAEKMVEEAGGGEYMKVQFHPGYDYSDFIIGLKPVKPEVEGGQVTFEWKDGVFKEFADKALEAYKQAEKIAKEQKEQAEKTKDEEIKAKPYIFIIDEINRADLSRVFGEVFSLLEEDYRYPNKEKGITLPNKKDFILPRNLYIIGTMNDIDRSVESMDFALRRRFSWKEVTAESSASIIFAKGEDGNFKITNENDRSVLEQAMTELNKYIGGKELPIDEKREQKVSLNLGTEYQLGGAYFLNFSKYQKESNPFELLWSNHIAIILNEYLRGRSNREQILSALKAEYDKAWKGNGTNDDGKKDKKEDDTGNATADSTPEQPKAKEANQ